MDIRQIGCTLKVAFPRNTESVKFIFRVNTKGSAKQGHVNQGST